MDENQVDTTPTEVVDTETPAPTETPELTEVEQRAIEMGWRPKADFNGNEDDFIDAKEFVRRKPLFDKIEHTTKEVKQLRKALDALKTHYTKVQETEYNRALTRLKEARQEAITNSDGAAFDMFDNEIKRVEKEAATISEVGSVEEEPVAHPEFVSWTNKNPWYQSVGYMRKFADDVGVRLANQGMAPGDVLKEVEKAVRKEFPQKFINPNKVNAPDVENGKPTSTGKRENQMDLTDQERRIMNTLVSTGQMTKEQYLSDLKKIKGIK